MAKVEILRRRVSLCGHVRDAVSGAAVPDALVEVLRRDLSAHTRADGFYAFLDLRAGEYDLRVSAPQAAGRYGSASVDDVKVAYDVAGTPALDSRANVALPPTAVAGRVSDATSGAPIADALAGLRGAETQARTSADGRYRLSPLLPGNPTLEIRARGYAPETRKLQLQAGAQLNVDLTLTKL